MLQFFILGPTLLFTSPCIPLRGNKWLGAVTKHSAKHVLFIEKRIDDISCFRQNVPVVVGRGIVGNVRFSPTPPVVVTVLKQDRFITLLRDLCR